MKIRASFRGAAAALAVLAASACSEIAGSGDSPGFRFDSAPDPREYLLPIGEPVVTVTVEPGRIRLDAMLTEGTACRTFRGSLDDAEGVLAVRVKIGERTGACRQSIANFTYGARLTRLEPGTYTVRLIHQYENDLRPERVVLEQQVTVE